MTLSYMTNCTTISDRRAPIAIPFDWKLLHGTTREALRLRCGDVVDSSNIVVLILDNYEFV